MYDRAHVRYPLEGGTKVASTKKKREAIDP